MDAQQEAKAGPATAESKSEWTRPEVERLLPGDAQTGGDTSVDGANTLS